MNIMSNIINFGRKINQVNEHCNTFLLVGNSYDYCHYVALHTRATVMDIQAIYSFCDISDISKEWLVENLGAHLNQGKQFKRFVICDVPLSSIVGE